MPPIMISNKKDKAKLLIIKIINMVKGAIIKSSSSIDKRVIYPELLIIAT